MFWRRKKKGSDPLDDPRFAPAGTATPAPSADAPPVSPAGGSTLTVEDVFTITGRGTVATGKVESGTLRVGQQVAVFRQGTTVAGAEIQAIEAFRKTIEMAQVGESVGLLLSGLSRDVLQRGDQIVVTD